MDAVTIAEKMARDPLFNPKTMGMRSTEIRELRSGSPVPPAARLNGPVRSTGAGSHQLYTSSLNISSTQQYPLHEHNKRFSASAIALHSSHLYSNPRASPTAMLRLPQAIQDRSRSLKNLNYKSSPDRDDRAILNWLSGVIGYKISDYSMLYDGTVLCQLVNTIRSNTINIDHYRDKAPVEKLRIAFYSMKQYLNINGPTASIESIIEGKEDDLLFLYLEKVKLFYCTSYGANANTKMSGSTKSLNRSHSLNAADNKHPTRDYRTQTSIPSYPTSSLYANSSCSNLESIKESNSTEKVNMKPRPHSYHELSSVHHLTSSSGARVIAVETGSASEDEIESGIPDFMEDNKPPTQVAMTTANTKVNSSFSSKKAPSSLLANNFLLPTSILKKTSDTASSVVSSTLESSEPTSDQVESSSNTSDDTKFPLSIGSVDGRRHSGGSVAVAVVTSPSRHQLPPLPKTAPPPLPVGVSAKRQLVAQMDLTDSQTSLQAFLSLSQSRRDLEANMSCDKCMETEDRVGSILKKERELVLRPLQRALESEKKKRRNLERKHTEAIAAATRKVEYYEKQNEDLSEKIASLTSQLEFQQKSTDERLAELTRDVASCKNEAAAVLGPLTPQPHDVTIPTDDAVQSRKTFRLFRKTSKKKSVREKGDGRAVAQTTSLKSFPTKDYFEHVESMNTFLQKLGYSHLIEKFMSNDIGLKELVLMDEAHLAKIGIPMGPRLRILQELQTLTAYV